MSNIEQAIHRFLSDRNRSNIQLEILFLMLRERFKSNSDSFSDVPFFATVSLNNDSELIFAIVIVYSYIVYIVNK